MTRAAGRATKTDAVGAYKHILAAVLDRRPSGTRQRLALALGKNRSFVTQITSPSYDTPIPARHVDLVMEICHFSPAERDAFLDAYKRAHPARHAAARPEPRMREMTVALPDLGSAERNRRLDAMLADFVEKLVELMAEGREPG